MYKIPPEFRDLPEAQRLRDAQAEFVEAAQEARDMSFDDEVEIRRIGEDLRAAQNALHDAQKAFDAVTGEPKPAGVTDRVVAEIRKFFPAERLAEVRALLDRDCGRTIPFRREANAAELDHIRLCVLRLSKGNMTELQKLIQMANVDERDVLLAAAPLMK